MEPQKGGAGKYCGAHAMIFLISVRTNNFKLPHFVFEEARSDGQEEEHVPISGC